MQKFKGTIYQVINIQNRKSYIGKTVHNFEEYKQDHLDNALGEKDLKKNKHGKNFYNAIRKYGPKNFKWVILGEIESYNMYDLIEKLNEAEKESIWIFRTFGSDGEKCNDIYGYNQTKGGDGGYTYIGFSEERKKESYTKMGNTTKGRKKSEEHKRKIGEGNKNKIVSEETKIKMRKPRKKKVIRTKEHNKKIGDANRKRNHINNYIDIEQQNKIIIYYLSNNATSIIETSKFFGISIWYTKKVLLNNNIKLKTLSEMYKGYFKGAETLKNLPLEEKLKRNELQSNRSKGENSNNAKPRLLLSPDGTEYYSCGDFHKICDKLKLDRRYLYKILKGELDNYKGWKCINLKQKR